MEQQHLRDLEYQCIQEQPPECTAACPIHLDARTFVRHVSNGAWNDAWKTLRRTMPFPGILGRICDAPCQDHCKRGDVGDPIQIHALEKKCVSMTPPRQNVLPLPARDKRVAVIGGGLSGLTVAWDLCRKGYLVEIFDPNPRLGHYLITYYPDALPPEVVDEELALLNKLKVRINLETDLDDPNFPEKCLNEFDAVFLSFEAVDSESWGLDKDAGGKVVVEIPMQRTSHEKIFAGGWDDSPIRRAAQGRWAATSMDRYLQNVSMTAGREKDGPFETRLFTSLEGVAPKPAIPMAKPEQGYSDEEAINEAGRCLQCECMECVKVCPYLEQFGSYPKKYAREIYNNESIVMGTRQANKLINSCSLCGLCEQVCPNDFAMQDLCLQVRESMVRRGKMPPSAHEFAILDMEFSQSERFALTKLEPGRDACEYMFFPGCQLSSSAPHQVEQVYSHLRKIITSGVGLMLGCCGAPAHWAGQAERFQQELKNWRTAWDEMNRPRIITACSTCYRMFKDYLPEIQGVSLWQVLVENGPPEESSQPDGPIVVHDPCTTRHEPEIQQYVRRLLDLFGVRVDELALSLEKTECCGFGGLMQNANPELAKDVVARRAELSNHDYLAYCSMCRDNLARVGKRTMHLLDIFFPFEGVADPASRPRPGWSERQENRARLKESVLKSIWKEDVPGMQEHQTVKLIMTPEISTLLDERRILTEDVQKVIHHAEKSGQRLLHPETGHYKASFKPFKATFWVEYSPTGDGFTIHNAYTHRMEVVGGNGQ
jgi:glutamate synthase (NADPH/NADH) small chain